MFKKRKPDSIDQNEEVQAPITPSPLFASSETSGTSGTELPTATRPTSTPNAFSGIKPLRNTSPLSTPKNTIQRTLTVGAGISVKGAIHDAEQLVVEGTVEASQIQATDLKISEGGIFRGEIEVEHAEIHGIIDGTLTVRNSLVIHSTGQVLGKAKCKRLQVEDGGQVSGQIEMITLTPSAASEETPAE